MRLLVMWLAYAAVCLSGDVGAAVHGQADPRASEPPAAAGAADRLYVAVLFLTDAIHQATLREDARVERICRNASDVAACTTREWRFPTRHFLRVRTAPSLSAPVAGDLFLTGRGSNTDLHVTLVYRSATDHRVRDWIRDVDWGYGPHLSGVRSRGAWIGLSGAPFDRDVWIHVGGEKHVRGEAESIAGRILELDEVRAMGADGRRFVLPRGSYFVTGVDRTGVVTLREELDIDMPCGEDVKAPTVMPPTFRAPAAAFFDARGRPRFAVKYTKGC